MLQQYAFGFYGVIIRLEKLRNMARAYRTSTKEVDEYDREEMSEILRALRKECEGLGTESTCDTISFMELGLSQEVKTYKYNDLLNDLNYLDFSFSNELRKRFFFRISDGKQDYFQKDNLFGPEVGKAFPSCVDEIQHAGSCFALEQWDASVFHLMKTLERGLNALAAKFTVPFIHTNWHNVIEQIEAKVRKMDSSFGADWKEQQKFYSEAASQFMFLKDAWRNYVMHAGDVYDEGKSLSVLRHVHELMQTLAKGGLHE